MPLFEGYNADQLHRVLYISRWLLAVLALVTAGTIIFNQWVSAQLEGRQRKEREGALERQLAAEHDLRESKARTEEASAQLAKFTAPRKLNEEQLSKLRAALRSGPRGKVVVTFLTVEWDAESYARQLTQLLTETGFDATLSTHLWVDLDHDGVFLCHGKGQSPPEQAVHLQKCFKGAGLKLESIEEPKIRQGVGAPDEAVVLVVSNRT